MLYQIPPRSQMSRDLQPPRFGIIPHPDRLRMPCLILASGIPPGNVHIMHSAIMKRRTFIFMTFTRSQPEVIWQMRMIAKSPISPLRINSLIVLWYQELRKYKLTVENKLEFSTHFTTSHSCSIVSATGFSEMTCCQMPLPS